jgi:class 3 adenylate cyclase
MSPGKYPYVRQRAQQDVMSASRPPRTLVASVLFVDLVEFSRASDTEQIEVKRALTRILRKTLSSIPEDDYRLMDTGDGAALGFLADPEHALYFALAIDAACNGSYPGSGFGPGALRIGINLGPVKEVFDVNDHPSLIGDGMNTAQRIVGFAEPGQITISRSFYELVSRLAPEYRNIFVHIGEHDDKHGREHDIYMLRPAKDILGKIRERLQLTVAEATGVNVVFARDADATAAPASETARRAESTAPAPQPAPTEVVWPNASIRSASERRRSGRPLLLGATAFALVVAIVAAASFLREGAHDGSAVAPQPPAATSAPSSRDAASIKPPGTTPAASQQAAPSAGAAAGAATVKAPADTSATGGSPSEPNPAAPSSMPAAGSSLPVNALPSTSKRPPRAPGSVKPAIPADDNSDAPRSPQPATTGNPAARGSYTRCSTLMQKTTLGESLTASERREMEEFCR